MTDHRSPKNPITRSLATGLIMVNLAVFLAGCLGEYHYLFDLASHFRIYVTIGYVVGVLVLWWCGERKRAMLGALLALYLVSSILGYYLPQAKETGVARPSFRLIAFNVLTSNRNRKGVVDYLREQSPDLILLQEVNGAWIETLDAGLKPDWPYQICNPREDNFGIALYSRYPLRDIQVLELDGQTDIPAVSALVEFRDQKQLKLLGIHPLPPVSHRNWQQRNATFTEVAKRVRSEAHDALIVAGDMNCTPWSVWFTKLLRESGLENGMQGHGIKMTWSMHGRPWLGLPIDHTLVNDRVLVKRRGTGPQLGSDHLPVEIDFVIR